MLVKLFVGVRLERNSGLFDGEPKDLIESLGLAHFVASSWNSLHISFCKDPTYLGSFFLLSLFTWVGL